MKFCALCWRPVLSIKSEFGKSRYFCAAHQASGESKKEHLFQKRRIISFLKARGCDLEQTQRGKIFYEKLSKQLESLSANSAIIIDKQFDVDTKIASIFKQFMTTVSRQYPISFKKLKLIKDISPVEDTDVITSVLIALENTAFIKDLSKQNSMFEGMRKPEQWLPILLRIVARHEAVRTVNEFNFRPGPISSKHKKRELRQKLALRFEELQREDCKRKQKILAGEFGLSEQRVSVLLKEYKSKV